jgi:hypothetical protein
VFSLHSEQNSKILFYRLKNSDIKVCLWLNAYQINFVHGKTHEREIKSGEKHVRRKENFCFAKRLEKNKIKWEEKGG